MSSVDSSTSILRVKKLSPTASLPVRGSPLSAGFDLASAENKVVPAKGKAVVKTDLSVACPPGTYARIAPRSGLAVKKFIDTGAGVVDADYRGNVGVVLFNFGDEDFEVKVGDRIAQMILESVCMADAVEVEDLEETERGVGGFGSTGVDKALGDKPTTTFTECSEGKDPNAVRAAKMLCFLAMIDRTFTNSTPEFYERWTNIRPALKDLALDNDERLHIFTLAQSSMVEKESPESVIESLEILLK